MSLELDAVTRRFAAHTAVDAVSVEVDSGEFFAVLGPSGCGKSTLLRCIAGLDAIDGGRIALHGRDVADDGHHVPPERRETAVVFQSYALWPHMDVLDNVAFPIEAAGAKRSAARAQAASHLDTVALEGYATRRPAELSGGQRQRVALARCLASGARHVLMDEPLANLDPHLRAIMETELARFHTQSGATTVYITHDQREAMALADRCAVMRDGRFVQVDAPRTLYDRPADEHVAAFIGQGSIVDGEVIAIAGSSSHPTARVRIADLDFEGACAPGTQVGSVRVLLRPEEIHLDPAAAGAWHITRAVYRGGSYECWLASAAHDGLLLTAESRVHFAAGDSVSVRASSGWVIPAM